MNHLKVSTRLTILVGVLSVLLVVVGGLGLFGIGQSNDALKSAYEQSTVPAAQLGRINSLVLHNRLAVYAALVIPTPENIQARGAEVESNIATISKEWAAYMTTQLAPEEAALAKAFAEDRKSFMQEAMLPTLAALRANDLKEAQRLAAEKIGPLAVPMETGHRGARQDPDRRRSQKLRRSGRALCHDPRRRDSGDRGRAVVRRAVRIPDGELDQARARR